MKWAVRLAPFSLVHKPIKAVKGQVVADFLADHSAGNTLCQELEEKAEQ